MESSPALVWWILTGALIVAELFTGTFHLLLLALGTAAAALASHLGLGTAWQLLLASLSAAGSALLWYRRRSRRTAVAASRPDLGLDIGQRVTVEHWDGDGSSRVHYRGAAWSARYVGGGTPQPGLHRIRSIDGSQLLLEPEAR